MQTKWRCHPILLLAPPPEMVRLYKMGREEKRWRPSACAALLSVAMADNGENRVGWGRCTGFIARSTDHGAQIIDRGHGPEIEGTRITVSDVMDYLQEGWRYEQIAGLFCLPPDDIQAAIAYIEAHEEKVTTAYRQLLARHCNVQYAPEVEAKLARNRQKLQAKLADIRARQQAERAPANDHDGS